MFPTADRNLTSRVGTALLFCACLLAFSPVLVEHGTSVLAQSDATPPDDDCEALLDIVIDMQLEISDKEAERDSLEKVLEQLSDDCKKLALRIRRHAGITADGDDLPLPPELLADFQQSLGACSAAKAMLEECDEELDNLRALRDYWLDLYWDNC